ncbi:MAG: dNTP triphosphohydrolase [Flavobacteriales bacterium]|nr:dNTP triphosphohydrolase [Flavobacteriales bacterium]
MKPVHLEPWRSEFDKDFDRIIFSHPFRRLQDKTQVVPMAREDFVHNRLTHSLEVAVVGRTLGRRGGHLMLETHYPHLRETLTSHDIGTLVSAACLAHDIGNPPFGHAGEAALGLAFREIFKEGYFPEFSEAEKADFEHFEGNAQGFRILASGHMRLTAALLTVFMKYPRPSRSDEPLPQGRAGKKFGYFQTEKACAEAALALCGLSHPKPARRHPLTWLVEAADDICYLIIDLEDAARMGRISFEAYLELLRPLCGAKLKPDKLQQEKDKNEQLGVLRALAINELVEATLEVFEKKFPQIAEGTFESSLTDACSLSASLRHIGQFSKENIYNAPDVAEVQAVGFEVLPGLAKIFISAMENHVRDQAGPQERNLLHVLPEVLRKNLTPQTPPLLRAHLMADWLSGLTDRGAVHLYRKLKGIAL